MRNIYHITENISLESGGVRTILKLLHEYLESQHFNSSIITNKKEINDDYTEFKSNRIWNYNKELGSFLKKIEVVDIFHLHGIYTYTQYIASKVSLEKKLPYFVSPHGMLEPWILEKGALKKKLYLGLILNHLLKKASVLHAITPLEKNNLFKLTNHKKIVEIPNLFDFNLVSSDSISYAPKEDYLIYIGRIDKKKGIELIINSLSKISNKNIKLKILGTENEYSNYLKSIITRLNLEDKIEFLGAIYNHEKYNLIANARALIAPSYSEAIGMVNLEAAACKTPVITTFQTGIKKEWSDNGGKLINPNEEELKQAIFECLSWNHSERVDRGNSLCNYAYENYSWNKKGNLWNELYSSI